MLTSLLIFYLWSLFLPTYGITHCTSTLRKTLFPSSSSITPSIPLLPAEVDILMQRRNTKIGSMYDTYDILYNERLAKNAICGRADVESAIKAIQRFSLQLDRSDGRPDISLPLLANKFDDFISICLRTDGAAWTAAIGPLEYLGLKYSSFKKIDDKNSNIIFDTPQLCNTVCLILLDMQSKDIQKNMDIILHRNFIWNLSLVIVRLFIRNLVFENDLNGLEKEENYQFLCMKYDDNSNNYYNNNENNDNSIDSGNGNDNSDDINDNNSNDIRSNDNNHANDKKNTITASPPSFILESILSLDLCIPYDINTIDNYFIISKDDMLLWKNKNKL